MCHKPKVSIIVPIYNVEDYLEACVNSLRNQSLDDIEIILVDDGSPDRSGAIADDLARRDPRIRVVHQSNQGLGPARNSGMSVAGGEYVGFVDSDDWVDPDMYERLYTAAKASDSEIVLTGLRTVCCGEVNSVFPQPLAGETLIGQRDIFKLRSAYFGAMPCKLKDDPTPISACVGIFKLDYLKSIGASFRAIRSEDIAFQIEIGRLARSITCISGTPYCYRKDEQSSITKSFNAKTIDTFFELFQILFDLAGEEAVEYRQESLLRVKRRVIDYSRVLAGMIEDSSITVAQKREFIAEVVRSSFLRIALDGYPYWKLPWGQMAFFLSLQAKSTVLVRALVRLRRASNVN